MKYQAVIFDLDGTLADTLAGIAEAGNHMLTALGYSSRPVNDFRTLAGQGLVNLIQDAIEGDVDDATVDRGTALMADYYAKHPHLHEQSFDDIPPMLAALTERGYRLAVLSNKIDASTVSTVPVLFPDCKFEVVRGAREGVPLKPDPTAALEIIKQLDLTPQQCVYVGDTRADMLTGVRAGMFTVGVTWGFRDEAELRESGADAIIHEPMALLDLLP